MCGPNIFSKLQDIPMQTSLDCLVCFIRQARATGKLATENPVARRRIIEKAGRFLETADPELSPPENAIALYTMFSSVLQVADPFARVKQESNELALAMRAEMEKRIVRAADPLRAAIRVAIGGNIIDYAAQHVFDVEKTMDSCFEQEFILDDYPVLQQALAAAGPEADLLYLCDNCGEIVFDALLVEQLQKLGCRVTAAVRRFPIINDATMEDARGSGLDRICPVITNGTGCPGTPLADCSEEFRNHFKAADIIISKGMGNYETLSEEQAPIFFLFTVKCSEVARHVTGRKQLAPGRLTGTGEMILMQQGLGQ
jgi:uncharacterized protein with ATP-grasp and redox domains